MNLKRIIPRLLILLPLLASAQAKYQDSSLSPRERAQDLLQHLTADEKIALMIDVSQPVERLGIKPYNWWNEALHGVARAGLATVFPQPIGLAASFDPDLIHRIYTAVSDEARAKNTLSSAQGSYKRYQGLTMWTPTVNIFRDPRWGRGIETYGEDPYLTSLLGVEVVKGLQGPVDADYDKLHACAKHFAVHSGPEWNRHSFDANNISPRDLHESYLPPFKALVQEAGVKEVMCAYNRFEGEPCCGSRTLLMDILRGEWGFEGIVLSDCGAIADFYNERGHKTHPDAATAAAAAVLAGTDLECGSTYRSLKAGLQQGLISEEDVDVSLLRLLQARFELGEMDDPARVSWTQIPYSVVASAEHEALALEAARRSMTLLSNQDNILPLQRGGLRLALMGPNAHDSIMQWGNYNGSPAQSTTILQGLQAALGPDDSLIYEQACGLVENTVMRSAFGQCRSEQGPGFSAQYWNNAQQQGEAEVETLENRPFNFVTSGATVFAPGVNLNDFSARYTSVFTPRESGVVVFDFFICGRMTLSIDGVEVRSARTNHGPRASTHKLKVEEGRAYRIQIDFAYTMDDAQLNFDLGYQEELDLLAAVQKVADVDYVIFAGGLSPGLEGEEMSVNYEGFHRGDRTEITLPAVQRRLIKALYQAGKQIIFVNCSGSPIALQDEAQYCRAILQAWYPGQAGGRAVTEVLLGDYNPSGRLPVTFYTGLDQLPDFEDYSMQGRGYRYMHQEPLFAFGYGLSYSEFSYGRPSISSRSAKLGRTIRLTVPIQNRSERAGEEVVQVYLRKKDDLQGPIKTLRAIRRVALEAGQRQVLQIDLQPAQLEWWDEGTQRMKLLPGAYELMVGSSSRDRDLQKLNLHLR